MAGADDNVAGLKLEKNRLEKQADGRLAAQGTGQYEHIKVEMVLPAVGFAAEPIAGVPFDDKAKIIANADGRVVDAVTRNVLANEYVVGWARTGAQGLIGSHKAASAHVAEHMVADGKDLESRLLPERNAIVEELARRGVRVVSFDDWRKLDEAETARGARRGAVRDKITDVESMLSILGQS